MLSLCLLFFGLVTCCLSDPCGISGDDCNANIVFVMDSSGSVTLDQWADQISFVNGVIDSIGSPSNIGIIEFDTTARPIWDLCDSQDECDDITDALDDFSFDFGGDNLPNAVGYGIFMLNNCTDTVSPNVLILLTNGYNGGACDLDYTNVDQVYLVRFEHLFLANNPAYDSSLDCIVDDVTTDRFDLNSSSAVTDLSNQLRNDICPTTVGSCGITYCSGSACSCSEATNCQTCNDPSGCAQCESGYFKLAANVQCSPCDSSTVGDGCSFCQDFNGCGQCQFGYTREYDSDCQFWKCV